MAAGKNDNGVVEFEFRKRENRTKWETIQKAIYDPDKKEFLGRTSKSWGQLLLFYTIFYIILAALFAICMQGLFATLDEKEPKWQMERSLIGTNPGLGFRPLSDKIEEGSLIKYNVSEPKTMQTLIDSMNRFFEPYNRSNTGENFVICDADKPPEPGKICFIDLEDFKKCSPSNQYGYNSTSPCVFVKLNRIFGWTPDYYTEPTAEMPQDLQTRISQAKNKKQVWISCEGLKGDDKEKLKQFEYFPEGLAGYYYPFRNDKHYLSPVVAVRIVNPKVNTVISIECRAWAKNIEYIGGADIKRAGSVKFDIFIKT